MRSRGIPVVLLALLGAATCYVSTYMRMLHTGARDAELLEAFGGGAARVPLVDRGQAHAGAPAAHAAEVAASATSPGPPPPSPPVATTPAAESALATAPADPGARGGGAASAAGPATIPLDVDKLAWLHIPKVGTSFVNTILTWACPGLGREDVIGRQIYNDLPQSVPKKWRCPGKLVRSLECTHKALVTKNSSCNSLPRSDGHFVALFRQPEQRLLSGYDHGRHGILNMSMDLPEYATRMAGCQTRMLVGERCSSWVRVTAKSAAKAVQRLEKSFAFVGILEEWPLTVCLFHAMFGGHCHQREFVNVRPSFRRMIGQLPVLGQYNTTGLRGWTDTTDGILYAYALERFHTDRRKFGVTWDTCRERICASHPEAFPRGGTVAPTLRSY